MIVCVLLHIIAYKGTEGHFTSIHYEALMESLENIALPRIRSEIRVGNVIDTFVSMKRSSDHQTENT